MALAASTPAQTPPDTTSWKENLLFIYDATVNKREEDPPEDAILVFLAPVEVELRTQIYLTGGLTALVQFAGNTTGGAVRVCKTKQYKIAHRSVGEFNLFMTGGHNEPDATLAAQLDGMYAAFRFFHGSFDRVRAREGYDRKRFASALSRLWAAIHAYYRPRRDLIHAAFCPTPLQTVTWAGNRYFVEARQIVRAARTLPGVLGGVVFHHQRVLNLELPPLIATAVLSLLQPTQSASFVDEDKRQIQRRGLKIRELLQREKCITKHEYRLRTYNHCFTGRDMIDVLTRRGEVRTREAGVQLGARLLQAGVIHHILNKHDFEDDAMALYRFHVDVDSARPDHTPLPTAMHRDADPYADGRAGGDAAHGQAGGSADLRPLVLSGFGRDARRVLAAHGPALPAGVHLLPVFLDVDVVNGLAREVMADGGARPVAPAPDCAAAVDVDDGCESDASDDEDDGGGGGEDNEDNEGDTVPAPAVDNTAEKGENGTDVVEATPAAADDTTVVDAAEESAAPTVAAPAAAAKPPRRRGTTTPIAADVSLPLSLDYMGLLRRLRLQKYARHFAHVHLGSASQLRQALALGTAALDDVAKGYAGDRAKLRARFTAAAAAMAAAGAARSRANPVADASDTTAGQCKMALYLQGVGGTVVALIVTPTVFATPPVLSDAAQQLGGLLASLENNLLTAAVDGVLGAARGPEAEEYNYLHYTRSTRGLAGWCSSDRGAPEGHWRPDTDEDAVFVAAAAQAHALFAGGAVADLTETVLRRQGGTPVYARTLFGAETFFQARRRGGGAGAGGGAGSSSQAGAVAALVHGTTAARAPPGWPFDTEFGELPALARAELARNQKLTCL